MPGSKKGSQESFEVVLPVLKHALDLINDAKKNVKEDHVKIQKQQQVDPAPSSLDESSNHYVLCHHSNHHHHDFHHEGISN